jgi:hypothetical protein
VVAVAVDLDHESLGPPEEVHGVRAHLDVDLGLGDAVAPADPQEEALKVAAGALGAVAEVGEGAGGVVVGMFQRCVVSSVVSVDERWRRMPGRWAWPVVPGTVTWANCGLVGESFQRCAALSWLSTAPSPQARTAAIQRPCRLRLR